VQHIGEGSEGCLTLRSGYYSSEHLEIRANPNSGGADWNGARQAATLALMSTARPFVKWTGNNSTLRRMIDTVTSATENRVDIRPKVRSVRLDG
jgi:hypothetical protein